MAGDGLFRKAMRQSATFLVTPRSILLGYALLDTALSWLRVDRLAHLALAQRVVIPAQISLMGDSFLILGAAIGLRMKSFPGYIISLACAIWVLRDGIDEWIVISSTDSFPVLSWSTLRQWWLVGGGVWEALRWSIAGAIVAYVLVLAARTRLHRRTPRETATHT